MSNKNWILIKNEIVENIILADDNFINSIRSQYDEVIDHATIPDAPMRPAIGGRYANGTFDTPVHDSVYHGFTPSPALSHLNAKAPSFTPLVTLPDSKYTFRVAKEVARIGCLNFNTLWLEYILHQTLRMNVSEIDRLKFDGANITYSYISPESNPLSPEPIICTFLLSAKDAEMILSELQKR